MGEGEWRGSINTVVFLYKLKPSLLTYKMTYPRVEHKFYSTFHL